MFQKKFSPYSKILINKLQVNFNMYSLLQAIISMSMINKLSIFS